MSRADRNPWLAKMSYTVPNDKMKMTVTWGDITSYIHGDGLTIGVLLLNICLAWVNLSFING